MPCPKNPPSRRTCLPDDGASEWVGTGYAHRAAGNDVVDRVLEVFARDPVADTRVIDASALHDAHLAVEDERVWGGGSSQRLGYGAVLVF
jgi:hypothetical protein